MEDKATSSKRKNETTITYKPTFKVRLTTTRKHRSTRIKECAVFPRKALKKTKPSIISIPLLSHGSIEESPLPTKRSKPYRERKAREVESWKKIRSSLLSAAIQMKAPVSNVCCLCDAEDAQYRCHDCCPLPLCYACVLSSHVLQPLHIIEKLLPQHQHIYWPTTIKKLHTLRVPGVIPPGNECQKNITLVDSKGRTHHGCVIKYSAPPGMGDAMFPTALVKLGFWPMSPSAPTTAVSLELLSFLQCLTLECHTSASGFVSAVKKAAFNPHKVISRLHYILRGECLPEFRLFWHALDRGPISLLPDLRQWQKVCPACPKTPDDGPLIMSFDGNFGLVHKSNSGVTYSTESPVADLYFINQEKVDTFVGSYYQDTKDRTEDCSQFQAGNVVRSKNKAANLNVTGVFGSTCKHEVPHLFMDLRHGERLSYPVMLLKEIKEQKPEDIQLKLLYDIACTLASHLKKRKNEPILQGVQLAIPVFHSYGHKGVCQVTMNPRRMKGFGLTDGEQLERLWSYLRVFSKISKEQTPGHRKELLAMAMLNYAQKKMDTIENQLVDRLHRAKQTKKTARMVVAKEVHEICEILSIRNQEDFLLKLQSDEEEYHKFLKKPPPNLQGTWKQAYAKELLKFNTLNAQLHSGLVRAEDAEKVIETTRAIQSSTKKLSSYERKYKFKRWPPTSDEYQQQLGIIEDGRKSGLLAELQALLIEKQFYYAVRKEKAESGQSVANRISERVKKVNNRISVVIKGYNAGSSDGLPTKLPAVLHTRDVTLENDIFDGMHPKAKAGDVPYSIRRRILDNHYLQERCSEEIDIIHVEMKNTYRHFCQLHEELADFLNHIVCSTAYERGLHGIGFLCIIGLEARLLIMYQKLKNHTDIPNTPEGYCPQQEPMTADLAENHARHEKEEEEEREREERDEEDSEEEDDQEEIRSSSDEEDHWSDVETVLSSGGTIIE